MKNKLIIYNVVITIIALALMFMFGIMVTNSNNRAATEKKIKEIAAVYVANFDDDISLPTDNDVRVTVIDVEGKVIKDNGSYAIEENHLYREEIKAAALGNPAVVVRQSDTLEKEMMYYAEAVKDAEGNISAYIRIAIPTEDITAYALKSIVPTVVILLCVWACSVTASVLLTGVLLKPLKQVKHGLAQIENGTYKKTEPNTGDGDIDQILADINDISEKLNDGKEIRTEFFANASHELKTPLTTIKGFNDMITLTSKDKDISDYSARISKEIDRVTNLLGDMLDLSKLENSALPRENSTAVNMREVAEEIKDSLRTFADERHVKLSVEGNATVTAEVEHIYELIKNLAENGIRYNDSGGKVEIKLGTSDNRAVLVVADDGIGIAEEHQNRIFERFYRVDKSRSRATGGTGLGLAIVKHICELYNAELTLTSSLGAGTTVTVVFDKKAAVSS